MAIRITILLLSFVVALPVQAQQKVHGTVHDVDGTGIPAVVYSIDFKATAQCDEQGVFHLTISNPLPIDTITIRQLGFLDRKIVVASRDTNLNTVVLQRQVVALDCVPISAREADNIIHQTFARIPFNYPQQKTIYPAFYRQVHKENGHYVRLIETSLDIAEPKYDNQRHIDSNTGMHIKHIRRSGVYEDNGDTHGDHLADLLADNPVQYFYGTFLNPSAGKDVIFWIDTASLYRKDSVVVIGYTAHTPADVKLETGKVYIYRPDMAIIRIESIRKRNKNIPLQNSGVLHSWELINGSRIVQFVRIGHIYYLDSMVMAYTHDVREREFSSKAWRVDEQFSIWFETPNISFDATDIPFSVFGNLYGQHYKYNSTFWQCYNMLKSHPLETIVDRELASHQPLEVQFAKEE